MRSYLKHWWRLIFLYPKKTLSEGDESYEAYWRERGRSDVKLSPWQKERTDIAKRYIDEKKSDTFSITDIGCGDGAVLAYLKTTHPHIKGTGIDFSETVLRRANESGIETVAVDFTNPENLSIPKTDYVILFEIIEHIVNSELLVQKALESASKAVFISIPNSGFFTYRLRLLFGKFPVQWIVKPHEHVHFWTYSDVRWWLKALGLEKQSIIRTYQGVPILKHIFPGLFAAGMVIILKKELM